ncbi:MAG: shikimate kinase [Actinobacteria bacterium]|nr:shikimate kinase [Actinomycetota bacterium]
MTTVRHLVLVGMMGTGKTTVGHEVAARMDWSFVDVDAEIEARQGRTIPDIFRDDGEPAFRMIERSVLADVLATPERSVIAAGGGAVLDSANRDAMRARGTVVWLRAQADEIQRRVGAVSGRPLLDGSPAATARRIEELVSSREAAYHRVAHDVVNVDHLTVDEVADKLCSFLRAEP